MTPRPLIVCVLLALALTGCRPSSPPSPQTPSPTPTPRPAPTPVPTPTPSPTPYVPAKTLQTGSIFNGFQFRANLETSLGSTATTDRNQADSYAVEVNVKVKVPKPHRELAELRKLNDNLATLLPELPAMLEIAKVSPEFDELYRNKVTALRTNLNRLDQLMTRHNFYDCETILELQSLTTKRRALLLQADMDVDTDGSDGDRVASIENDSRTFQPMTSYHWPRRTQTPNPFIAVWEKRIKTSEDRIADTKTSSADAQRLKAELPRLRDEVRDMQTFSYLVGALDPFIVLPSSMFGGNKGPFTPSVGDYCVVIAGDTLYPAIVGDAGPINKAGEASLRICKQISATATGGIRPMNDLKATYLVFPGSAEKPWSAPDAVKWRARCEQLLTELGGYHGTLFTWPDLTPPAPAPPENVPATPENSAAQPPKTPLELR